MYKRIKLNISLCFYISLFCVVPLTLQSQTFGLNLEAGLVVSQIDGDAEAGYNKPGPFIGLNGEVHFKKNLDLQIGIAYAFRGSQSELFPDNSYPQLKIALQYIDIPVTLHYKDWYQEEKDFYRMNFFGGFYYGRLFSASAENSPFDLLTDEFNKNEVGIILGGSYNFDKHSAFGVKWCRGLNYLYDPDKNITNVRSLINRFIHFYYEYQF